jgi:hypothetical protein
MPSNVTLYLDNETHDIAIADGTFVMTADAAAIVQNIRNTLLVYLGEFPLDEEHGTDWERVFGEANITDEEISEIVRDAIFQEEFVQEVESVTILRNETARSINVLFIAVLGDGTTIQQEVLV